MRHMSFALPEHALSIRQPWAWAVIHAGKDIENRDWSQFNPGLKFRGSVAIHASAGMTQDEYFDAWGDIRHIRIGIDAVPEKLAEPPQASQLQFGGIIGVADVVDAVTASDSPWFVGPVGLVLANPRPVPFLRCRGALGFFKWKHEPAFEPVKLAKWMTG
jgi:hypothetical protein